MQTPRNLDEAKALVKGERTKLTTAFSTAIGSRWLLAIVATFALAFASQMARNDFPAVAYAAVYPLTMLLRIIAAQVIAQTG